MFSKRIKFSVLQIKSTYLVSILYSVLFDRVSGRFEAFRRVSASWWCATINEVKAGDLTSFIVAHHQRGEGGTPI